MSAWFTSSVYDLYRYPAQECDACLWCVVDLQQEFILGLVHVLYSLTAILLL